MVMLEEETALEEERPLKLDAYSFVDMIHRLEKRGWKGSYDDSLCRQGHTCRGGSMRLMIPMGKFVWRSEEALPISLGYFYMSNQNRQFEYWKALLKLTLSDCQINSWRM